MKIEEVLNYLEGLAPIASQESYDNCGLITGDQSAELKGILVTLDCIEATVEDAVSKGANLIVAHHPIVFKGLKKINGKDYVERTIIKAIKNDIAIYAIHTNFDNYSEGVNKEIADRIGVKNPKILLPKTEVLNKLVCYVPKEAASILSTALYEAGAGRIGNYNECSFKTTGIGTYTPAEGANPTEGEIGVRHETEEYKLEVLVSSHLLYSVLSAMRENHPYEEVAYEVYSILNENQDEGSGMVGNINPTDEKAFLSQLKSTFNCGVIRHTKLLNKPIEKVAFCGGAGSFLLKNAINSGADIFITGDFKYHEFFDAEDKIVIADIGHFESEQFTSNRIGVILTKKFPKFAVHLTEVNTNPINYF